MISLVNMTNYLKNLPRHKQSKPEKDFEILLHRTILSNQRGGKGYKVQTTTEAQQDFVSLACLAAESRNETLIDIVNKSLDEAFDTACQFHNFILK